MRVVGSLYLDGTTIKLKNSTANGATNIVAGSVASGADINITLPLWSTTFLATAATSITLPTTGTLATLAGAEALTNKTLTSPKINENVALTTTSTILNLLTGAAGTTGTASTNIVFSTSPTLVTPVLGAATATTINGLTITTSAAGVLTIAASKTLSVSNTLTFTGTDTSSVAFGTGGTVAYTGGTLAQFASTTSLQLKTLISDETGSGSLVFADTPTLVTPVLGVATATSINKVAITAPATASTLTIADGSSLITSGAYSLTLTTTATTDVTLPTTGTLVNSAVATLSSLTTVGALNSGSITSGFGAIDIGADALTAGAGSFTTLASSGVATLGAGAGAALSALVHVSNGKSLKIQRASADTGTSPTTVANGYLLRLGSYDYGVGGLHLIGMGYLAGTATYHPAHIGFIETSTGSYSKGDLIFATRDATTDTEPTIVGRTSSAGAWTLGTNATGFTGNLIYGAIDGIAQAAGFVGEVLEASSAGVTAVNNEYVHVCSKLLTKGLWLVSIHQTMSGTITGTRWVAGISSDATVNSFTDKSLQNGNAAESTMMATSGSNTSLSIANYSINLNADTTYYMKAFVSFSGGTPSMIGRMTAVRIA